MPDHGPLKIVDTHCHLDWPGFDAGRSRLLDDARQVGVAGWVLPGVSPDHWTEIERLAREHPGCFQAPGVHPQHAGEWDRAARMELERRLRARQCVAVGEIGLDRAIDVDMEYQKRAFADQLAMAAQFGLPVLLHVRRAHRQAVEMVLAAGPPKVVWHCYSGSAELVRQVHGLDHYFSFSGVITYPAARKFEPVFAAVPLDRLLIETDAPDLAPHPHRGETCLPAHIGLTLRRMAGLTGLAIADLAARLYDNTRRALGKDFDHAPA